MKRRFAVLAALAALTTLILLLPGKSHSQNIAPHYLIKLYEGGKIVGTWNALNAGRVDGQSLTFAINDEVNPRTVRIQGTYTVEQQEE